MSDRLRGCYNYTNEVYNTVNFNFILSNIVLIRDLKLNWDYANEDNVLDAREFLGSIYTLKFRQSISILYYR
jgi:hypothetical protein